MKPRDNNRTDEPQSDQQQLNALMRAFYEVISFEEGSAPDWDSMASLFSMHARITRVTPEATDYMELSGFRNMVEELLEVGAVTSFFESEILRRTDRFGNVIHIASAYETRISPTAIDYLERGVNSLQRAEQRGRVAIEHPRGQPWGELSISGFRIHVRSKPPTVTSRPRQTRG